MKRTQLLYALPLLLLSCGAPAENPQTAEPETTAERPNWSHNYSLSFDIPYGEDPAQRLDVYSQGHRVGEPDWWTPDTEAHPTLIYIHGGGWVGGAKESQVPDLIPYLERGWNVVNVEYRLGENTAPAAVEDAMCAIAWVADHASEFNIDPQRIVVTGSSAGGHLALITGILNKIPGSHCYAGDRLNVAAIINWYGITDIKRVEEYLRTYKPEWNYAGAWLTDGVQTDSVSRMYSPLERVTAEAPPILTLHGELDSVVPYNQAVLLHEKLEYLGLQHKLVSDPEGNHGGFSDAQYQHMYDEIFDFLDAHLK